MDEQISHTEAVLAFVHDAQPWAKLEPAQRREWQRRVAYVLSDESNDTFGEWTKDGLAPVLGIGATTLRHRLAWSEALSGSATEGRDYSKERVASVAKAIKEDPAAAEALLADPEVRDRISSALADRKAADAAAREYVAPLTKFLDQARADSAAEALDGFADKIRAYDEINADLTRLDESVVNYQLARSQLEVGV